mmetsp:Transcript_11716/g.11771  ORF Transcript_11716/g.11771 Transcript_11716/m.11771 type:complete len:525 (+) Transcript_11716:136-1710(+)
MLDIEDIGQHADAEDGVKISGVQVEKSNIIFPSSNPKHETDVDEQKSLIPGTQKIWMKTYGCSHNVSDSEYMEGILSSYGYRITNEMDDADVWLLNSCTVKDPSQAAFMNLVKKAKDANRAVVVAGCVPQADRDLPGLEEVSVVGIQQIDRVVEIVEQTLQGNTVKMLGKKELPSLNLPKIRKNPLVEIIPLSTGCLGACTYCKTKHARGQLGSYSLETIVNRVQSVVAEGVREVWLSSEDTGAYGRDLGCDISKLLRAIISVLPEEGVMLRIGMTNPPFILEHLEAIAEALNHPKVFSFLHVPVQSGSDRVLEAMNREYTVSEFRRVVDYLQKHVPDVTIATDIICGFPTELPSDFEDTMRLMAQYRLAIVNISQFYPRPGTPAAKMKRIKTQDVKERSRRLTRLFESFTPYKHLKGRKERVWFNTEISSDGEHSVGHTKSYVKVLVPLDSRLPGSNNIVRIINSERFHVTGIVMSEHTTESKNEYALDSVVDTAIVISSILIISGVCCLTISPFLRFLKSIK